VVGTNAFMDFVESIQAEGVVLERKPMGEGTQPKTPLVVEIDKENVKKAKEAYQRACALGSRDACEKAQQLK